MIDVRRGRPRRIGIVRLSAIGDVIHAMPLAMALRRAHPEARITWIAQRAAAPLLEGHPAVDDVLLFPRGGTLAELRRFASDLRARRLDVTVDPQGNAKSGFIALLSGAPIRAGLRPRDCKEPVNALATNRFGRPPRSPHGVDRAFAAGTALGVEPGRDEWGLRARPEELEAWGRRAREAGIDPEGALLSIHLTDPDDDRSWYAEGLAEVVREAVRSGRRVVLNGEAARRPLADSIRGMSGGAGVSDLTGRDDLRGLLAQFEAMAARPGSLLLAPDSGPVHLAVAAGLPVVCLSGPQDPARTGPRSGGVAVVTEKWLWCRPCLERRCIRRPPDRACMRGIEPARVLAAIEEALRSAARPPSARAGPARPSTA
jgi:ADP-heptose:LPS heptosyltransferase